MKEKEGYVDYPEQQMILYVEKDDGKYGPMQTGSFISANYLDDYKLKRRNLEIGLREQLTANTISPLKYFMVLEDLTLSELSARAGIRKSRVRKQLTPQKFGSVTTNELQRYAAVFNIGVANLLQVVLVGINGNYESNLILENSAGHISVIHEPTANPFVVLTKIEERK